MSSESDIYWVKRGPCISSPRCDSLLKIKFKCYMLYVLRYLVLRYLSPSDGTRYQVINSEHCWFTVGHITLSTAGHFPCFELELCFAECAAFALQLEAQLQAAFVEQFSDNCNVFGKSPCQVAGGRSHNSGLMIAVQMFMLKWAWYPHSWVAWD
jgi:hypothetical protein